MNNRKNSAIYISEKYHGQIHLIFGLIAWLIIFLITKNSNFYSLLLVVVGAFLPDIDHLFFLFWYGRKTEYAKEMNKYFWKGDLVGFIEYGKKNHKNNTSILSHNVLIPVVTLILVIFSLSNGDNDIAYLFMSITFHFVYDMIEDYLMLGKLNGNWFLKYGNFS